MPPKEWLQAFNQTSANTKYSRSSVYTCGKKKINGFLSVFPWKHSGHIAILKMSVTKVRKRQKPKGKKMELMKKGMLVKTPWQAAKISSVCTLYGISEILLSLTNTVELPVRKAVHNVLLLNGHHYRRVLYRSALRWECMNRKNTDASFQDLSL